jgi:hypothetical protein
MKLPAQEEEYEQLAYSKTSYLVEAHSHGQDFRSYMVGIPESLKICTFSLFHSEPYHCPKASGHDPTCKSIVVIDQLATAMSHHILYM